MFASLCIASFLFLSTLFFFHFFCCSLSAFGEPFLFLSTLFSFIFFRCSSFAIGVPSFVSTVVPWTSRGTAWRRRTRLQRSPHPQAVRTRIPPLTRSIPALVRGGARQTDCVLCVCESVLFFSFKNVNEWRERVREQKPESAATLLLLLLLCGVLDKYAACY